MHITFYVVMPWWFKTRLHITDFRSRNSATLPISFSISAKFSPDYDEQPKKFNKVES